MFSIVIPLYNKAHTIEETLRSVFSQTYCEFEVIIVNDGSTDNGVETIHQHFSDKRLVIIEQENQGVSAARNRGVALAKFEYIAFLDGDDEWLPDYLKTIKLAVESFPNAGMFCCAGFIRNDTDVLRIADKYKNKIVEIDFFENPHVFLHSSASVISKKEFNKTKGFPIAMIRNEDYAFFFSLAFLTPVVYCGFPLSVYVGGVPGQATSTPDNVVIGHIVNRMNMIFENWEKADCKNKTFKIFLKYELRHMVISQLKHNDFLSNKYLANNLKPGILRLFASWEFKIYTKEQFKYPSICFILLTKLRWRLRGFPVVNY